MASTSTPPRRFLARQSRRGDRLLHDDVNDIKDALRRARIVADGAAVDGPGGTRLLSRQRRWIRTVQSPAAGIPGMVGSTPGQAVCTLRTWDGTSRTPGTETILVLNDYPGAVGANKVCKVHWEDGAWWDATESCA